MRREFAGMWLCGLVALLACGQASGQTQGTDGRDLAQVALGSTETPVEAADRLADQLQRHPVPASKEPDKLAGFLLDTRTGRVTRFVDQPEPGLLHTGSAEWTHDGKRIVFDAMPAPGNQWDQMRLELIERGKTGP